MCIISKKNKVNKKNICSHIDEEGKQSDPVTYGDLKINENGAEVPVETVLTHKSDSMVATSIDYIFQVIYSVLYFSLKELRMNQRVLKIAQILGF